MAYMAAIVTPADRVRTARGRRYKNSRKAGGAGDSDRGAMRPSTLRLSHSTSSGGRTTKVETTVSSRPQPAITPNSRRTPIPVSVRVKRATEVVRASAFNGLPQRLTDGMAGAPLLFVPSQEEDAVVHPDSDQQRG